ncbi:MAG: GH116 family glycosyl hydrolase [Acidimicrobiales bacterium]
MRFSRRRLLTAAPVGALGVALAACTASDPDSEVDAASGLWRIPDAAWSRPIGDHPPGATGLFPPLGSHLPARSRTKRGMPVGAVGTGSFMLNLSGSFGPWYMDPGGDDSANSRWGSPRNSGFEDRYLSQAAFHVRFGNLAANTVQTLATEDVLPAWPRLEPGSGTYAALFPKAWFVYDGLPLPVALKQVSPFVARNNRLSSLPAGLFEIAVTNPTGAPIDVACMLTFPNAPYRLPTDSFVYTREGLRSRSVERGRIRGVRLQAASSHNVAQTEKSEWVIAATGGPGARVTYTDDWAADGTGTDVLDAFSNTGSLPNGPIDHRGLGLAGALCVSFTLPPGGRQVASFALGWDFPVVQFPNPLRGTRWWRRYTQWYEGPYRAWDIAYDVLAGSPPVEKSVDAWWKRVAEDATYPAWLRSAALNELYYDLFGGTFWENGTVDKPKRFGKSQHLYFAIENEALRDCESFDVRHYETRHLLQLLPDIERDVLLGWAEFVEADPVGRTPHDAGSPVDDPWFVANQYNATSPGEPPRDVDWLDLPPKFVQQAHAFWRYTGDDAFAAALYPALQKTMGHLLSLDADGDGIPDATGYCTTYDAIEMYGASIYVAGLTVGACEAMADLAASFDSEGARAQWASAAARARTAAESALWTEEHGGYYRFDTAGPFSDTLMADALCGQRYASVYGLADIFDRDRMARHLTLVVERSLAATPSGAAGARNLVRLVTAPPLPFQGRSVWPGGSYFTAAVMHQIGSAAGRPDLVRAALTLGQGVYRTTYLDEDGAFWFDTPALWQTGPALRYRSPSYQRSRAAWELLCAVKDPFPPGWSPS